jgi:hypothetical protein
MPASHSCHIEVVWWAACAHTILNGCEQEGVRGRYWSCYNGTVHREREWSVTFRRNQENNKTYMCPCRIACEVGGIVLWLRGGQRAREGRQESGTEATKRESMHDRRSRASGWRREFICRLYRVSLGAKYFAYFITVVTAQTLHFL